jgi:hypothetical protein
MWTIIEMPIALIAVLTSSKRLERVCKKLNRKRKEKEVQENLFLGCISVAAFMAAMWVFFVAAAAATPL